MSLDEHLVVYFTSYATSSRGKDCIGDREDISCRLIQFIFSLKYYSTRWLRAKIFAEILGFLHCNGPLDYGRVENDVPDAYHKPNASLISASMGIDDLDFNDVDIPSTDIYVQEFFFYAYSYITRERKSF
jgi:hypothetical protein